MANPQISIIIPVYNEEEHISKTVNSILSQIHNNSAEIIVYDDCSTDNSFAVARQYQNKIRILKNKKNIGPAKTRNRAIKEALGEIVAFIDADAVAEEHWLNNILECFKDNKINVIMGNIKIPKSTFLGDSISALGFPGGGSVGFDKIWRVDAEGYTNHITSCNFAAQREIFHKYGMFDESFPFPGGEDPELSYRWTRKGVKIKYCPDIIVYHKPRKNLKSFIRWMIIRGRSSYLFKQKVDEVGSFIGLRIWSTKNIIKKFAFTPNIILILPLILLSFALQYWGLVLQAAKKK